MTQDPFDGVDLALAAYREEGAWQVDALAPGHLESVDTLAAALRRFPGDGGALGLVAVDEDFFVLLRVTGPRIQLLLSDVTAAEEWLLARSAVEHLSLPMPEEDDEPAPAGDLDILADLGMSAMDLGMLVDDDDLYPDEMLAEMAGRLGFGALFDEAAGPATP